jgi:Cu2+-exporting ATPase
MPPPVGTTSETEIYTISGLRCAGCIAKLEGGLLRVPGVVGARVNFTTKRVRVDHLPDIDAESIREKIIRLGFTAEPFAGGAAGSATNDSQILARALAVAGFAAMNVMLLSVSIWSGAQGATRDLFHWLSALIVLPAVAYAGRPFFRSAWSALRHGRTNMDVPISIGVVLACALSIYETAIGGPHAYFDGAIMLLFFLLAGRFLDSVMRARAEDSVAALMRRTATEALVLSPAGAATWRRVEELAPGMRILVAAGERIAADGVVEDGSSSIDRSLITGEGEPVRVGVGGAVLAGTLNVDAPLIVKITAAGPDTVIADIARLMEAAGQSKSLYVRIADRAARLYAPAVHTLAALSLLGWVLAGAGLHQSILIAVAVLIITCPCALGLAVPVSQVVAVGALMRAGIIVKDGSALERLAEADVALFDKTGTLTLGRPIPEMPPPLSKAEQGAALALSRLSRHPLSRSLAGALDQAGVEAAIVENPREEAGMGVEGRFKGEIARLGRPTWVGASKADILSEEGSVAAFRIGDGPVRILKFHDQLRPGAAAALDRLKGEGMEIMILSGDHEKAVETIARKVGVDMRAGLSPGDKFSFITGLGEAGRKVLMVGDGLNDGPALKAAYVSIAPSSASDVGQTAADLLFMGDALSPVPIAVTAARQTMKIVRQNFALAILYNLLAVPLAVAGLVTPLIAALAMSGSSLIVVANALRLRWAAR